LIAMLLVAVTGCAQPSEPAGQATQPATGDQGATDQADKLVGVTWNCFEFKVAGAPQTVPEDTPITAEFGADGTMSGSSGVNTYNTKYTTDADSMTIGPEIASTKMAGPEAAMTMESNYLTTLPTTVRYNILDSGELVLLDAADAAVARYRPAE
jgi:heat shock protein HslJ